MARSSWCAAILVLIISSWSEAGTLFSTGGGSTPFTFGTLSGTVDYHVYAPGTFPFSGGYAPTAGEFVYAYQVFVTGAAPLSSFELIIPGPADNIGNFTDLGGTAPLSQALGGIPQTAKWTFPGIPTNGFSRGLAFSSSQPPVDSLGTTVDTGQSAFVIPLPEPGSPNVPEPATMGLVAGAMLLGLRRRVK